MPKNRKIQGPALRTDGPALSEGQILQLCLGEDFFGDGFGGLAEVGVPWAKKSDLSRNFQILGNMQRAYHEHSVAVLAYNARHWPDNPCWALHAFEMGDLDLSPYVRH